MYYLGAQHSTSQDRIIKNLLKVKRLLLQLYGSREGYRYHLITNTSLLNINTLICQLNNSECLQSFFQTWPASPQPGMYHLSNCRWTKVSKIHQKFQTDKSHLSFFQIDRKIELCRNYIKVLDNFIDNRFFDNSFQIFSVLEPGFRLWRGRWVYWRRTNWFRDRYEKSSSNTVIDTVAKLSRANCQIAESMV